jgi:hypothetical protein
MSKPRRPTVPLQLAALMGTGAGFHAQASSDSFDHRLDIERTDRYNKPNAACLIPAPHNYKPSGINSAAAREGPWLLNIVPSASSRSASPRHHLLCNIISHGHAVV